MLSGRDSGQRRHGETVARCTLCAPSSQPCSHKFLVRGEIRQHGQWNVIVAAPARRCSCSERLCSEHALPARNVSVASTTGHAKHCAEAVDTLILDALALRGGDIQALGAADEVRADTSGLEQSASLIGSRVRDGARLTRELVLVTARTDGAEKSARPVAAGPGGALNPCVCA